jgi:hypothetical protein
VYGGKKPFSEAESRVVKLIAETVRPRAYVNLHSGEWAMYVPWDSKQELAPDLPVCRSFIFSPLLLSSLHYLLPCAIFIFFPVLSSSSLNCLLPCTIFFPVLSSSLFYLLPCAIFIFFLVLSSSLCYLHLLPCPIFFPVLSSSSSLCHLRSSLNCLLPCTIFFLCYLRSSSLNCLLPCAIFFNDIALLMQ